MRGTLRLALVFFAAAVLTLLLLPFQLLGKYVYQPIAAWIPFFYHKAICWLFGVRVRVNGSIPKKGPLLVVSNHISWLDIVILSAVGPHSFVAKAEMATWPIFGQLAWLQRTIFVKRQERRQSGKQVHEIAVRLNRGDIIVLYPEGTTSDGHELLPFKTPLFEAARRNSMDNGIDETIVLPVAIDYSHLHGLPIGRQWRQHVAWPGDVGLGEHFLPLVEKGALDVVVHVGQPIRFDRDMNRKVVSAQCAGQIRSMLRAGSSNPLDSSSHAP